MLEAARKRLDMTLDFLSTAMQTSKSCYYADAA